MSPLRGGWLTGKFPRGDRPVGDGSRIAATGRTDPAWTESWENYDNDRTWDLLDALTAIADRVSDRPRPYPYGHLDDLRQV